MVFKSKKKEKVLLCFDRSYQVVTVKAELSLLNRIFSTRSLTKALIMFSCGLCLRLLIKYLAEVDLYRDFFENYVAIFFFGVLCLNMVAIAEFIAHYDLDMFQNIQVFINYFINKFKLLKTKFISNLTNKIQFFSINIKDIIIAHINKK